MVEQANIEDFYQFVKEIGRGSFGQVQRAIKKDTGEMFAIKIIDKEQLQEDDIQNLQQEVEILTQIDHPNIVKLHEIFEDESNFYMVLELMTGGELLERIVEWEHFTERQAAETLIPVIDALHYCHLMNIAHRDLKPENLLYTSKEQGSIVKISDFGLARTFSNELMMTQCGTPGYVAPEIIQGGGYNQAVDYWSLGVILYIMLCGLPPFYSENTEELFELIQNGKFEFPSPQWDDISKEVKDLIRGLLTVDPVKRIDYDRIMQHPWIKGKGINNKPINHVKNKLKEFNARRQAKGGNALYTKSGKR